MSKWEGEVPLAFGREWAHSSSQADGQRAGWEVLRVPGRGKGNEGVPGARSWDGLCRSFSRKMRRIS